jgi:hypothetical protein
MSFENKGFPNSLTTRYEQMNYESLDGSTGVDPTFIGPMQPSGTVGAVLPVIESAGKKKQRKHWLKTLITKRKARRYKRKGNKIVKVDVDGKETGEVVTSPAELKKAVAEINTPDSELPIDNVTGREDLTANTELPEFTIMSSKKDKSKYIYITLAIIIIAVLLYLKFKKK